MRAQMNIMALVTALAALPGCGGGGGGPATYPLAVPLRSYQVGDQWHYGVTGSITQRRSPTRTVAGTLTYRVSAETVGRESLLVLSKTMDLRASDGSLINETNRTYFMQIVATGNVYCHAERIGNGPVREVTTIPVPVYYPGTWTSGWRHCCDLEFGDQGSSRQIVSISGSDIVVTPVGEFAAWKTQVTRDGYESSTVHQTEWWAPQIGSPVKLTIESTGPTGLTTSLIATLKGTNVPLR